MKTKHSLNLTSLALMATLACGCSTQTNTITYFQDIDQVPTEAWANQLEYTPRLQPTDEMAILVTAVDQAAVAAFNKPVPASFTSNSRIINAQPVIQTYVVDEQGCIDFPVLGRIKVEGMTSDDLRDELTTQISRYVENPQVTVSMTAFSVSVLGEVMHPGVSYFGKLRASVLEVLASRGDLTLYGDRSNVLLIRENNGKREHHRIDLTSADVINSPYYYMQQNDVIYVAPNQTRRSSARYNSMKQQNLSMISTIVSVISVLSSLAIAIWK